MARQIDAETQASLILRIRDKDDQSAWRTFVDVYSPLIYGFCRMKGLQANDAADVSQEALIRIAKAVRTFDYDRSKGLFRDWVAMIVHNEIRRHLRRDNRMPESTLEQDIPTNGISPEWDEHFQRHIFETALLRCQQHFEKSTWELFEHSWLKKETVEHVAKKFQVGAEKIYVARSRVLKRLKHEVAVLSDDIP